MYPFRGIAGVAKLLNLNVHFHTLVFDGVFTEGEGGALHFRSLPAPTDDEVGVVLATIYVRVCRLLRRQGFDATTADLSRPDPIAEESPMLAGISSASIQGRIALGPRAGRRVWRVGEEPTRHGCCRATRGTRTSPASISTRMWPDRARLEQLCRYLLRPPVAQERLRRMGDDHILLTLKTAWTRHLIYAPLELLERSSPKNRRALVPDDGAAPRARWSRARRGAPHRRLPAATWWLHDGSNAARRITTHAVGRHRCFSLAQHPRRVLAVGGDIEGPSVGVLQR